MRTKLHSDVYLGIFAMAFAAIMYYFATKLPTSAGLFPKFILIVIMCLGAGVLLTGFMKTKKPDASDPSASFSNIKYPLMLYGLILLYAVGMFTIGFYVSSGIFFIVTTLFFKYRNYKSIGVICIGLLIFLYLLFGLWLKVRMPNGIIV